MECDAAIEPRCGTLSPLETAWVRTVPHLESATVADLEQKQSEPAGDDEDN